VASATVGQLTLIDGSTAEVVARVEAAAPGDDLRSAQDGGIGYGLDRDHGTVARIDPASFQKGEAVEVIAGARGELDVHPQGDLLYVVDRGRGRVAVADATGAKLRGPVRSLAEPVVSSVVDERGRLWALGSRSGDLTWFDGADRGSRPAVARSEGARLAVVGGRTAVVEPGARTVRTLDDHGRPHGTACLDIDPSDRTVRVGGSVHDDRLYVVSGDDGLLRVSDLASEACGDVALTVAAARSKLGEPQEAQNRVFIPDYTTGTVAIADIAARRVVHTRRLVTAGVPFDLFAEDGIVFYNDRGSERAGVISIDGSFAAVAKYDPDRPGNGLDRDGDDSPLPDAAESDGADESAAGASDPGPGGAAQPDPPKADHPGPDRNDQSGRRPGGPRPQDGPDTSDDPPGTGDPGSTLPPGGLPTPGPDDTTGDPPGDPGGPGGPGGPGSPMPGDDLIEITAPAAEATVDEVLDLHLVAKDPDQTVSNVTWDFGDESSGAGADVAHSWSQPGGVTVVATATVDQLGVTTSVARGFTIQPQPDPDDTLQAAFGWSPTDVHAGQTVVFDDQSEGNPTSWLWTFHLPGTVVSTDQNPQQQFGFAGDWTATLEVRRNGEVSTLTQTIHVAEALPEKPEVSPPTIAAAPPYDDQTDYRVTAIIVNGPVSTCTWTIDGGPGIPCQTTGNHAGVEAFTFARFRAGHHAVRLVVSGDGGTSAQTLEFDVVALVPPRPNIAVVGASGSGGAYRVSEGTRLTFDGSGTTGSWTGQLEWHDDTTGAAAVGTVWAPPALSVDVHNIRLVAHSRFGDRTAMVRVEVVRSDPTAPTVTLEAIPYGPDIPMHVESDDPETGIVRVDAYGVVTGTCRTSDGTGTIKFQAGSAPFESTSGGGVWSPIAHIPCGTGSLIESTLDIHLWVIATNGNGMTARADYTGSGTFTWAPG
jgi:PKD repeat protein